MQVAIIGAGIVGIQCAHALLDEGHSVTLIDPDGLAQRTSSGNAGMLCNADFEPLASPKAWRQVPGWLLDPLGPLTIRPSYLPSVLPWMLRFLAASRPSRVAASRAGLRAINEGSYTAWERRLGKLGIADRHLRKRGYLWVFTRPGQREAFAGIFAQQRSLGIEVDVLDSAALRQREPAYGPRVHGGAHIKGGGAVDDPRSVSQALGQAALDRGARLIQRPVVQLKPRQGGVLVDLGGDRVEPDMAVIAAGAWSRVFAKALGDDVPLETERGYNVTLPKGALGISCTAIMEGLGIAITPNDGNDRLGGAVEFAGLAAAPNFARVDAMIARLKPFLPDAKLDGGTRWMGHRPSLPDSLPVIGRATTSDRVVYAFGSGHYGLTQSAIIGEMVAALVSQKPSPVDASHFGAERFKRW